MKNKITLRTPLLLLLLCFSSCNIFAQGAGSFVKYEKKGSILLVHGTLGDLKIEAFSADIFKIQVIKSSQTSFDSSFTVVMKPTGTIGTITESANNLEVMFDKCSLLINKSPLQVGLKTNAQIKIQEDKSFKQTSDSLYLSFTINPKDVFHGGGGIPVKVDLNKRVLQFYNTYVGAFYKNALGVENSIGNPNVQSLCVPFIVSSQKYGLLLDSNLPGKMQMDVGISDSTKLYISAQSSGKWAYYLINGESNDDILYNYTLLTGRQPLPPRWSFGYIQSKFGYQNTLDANNTVSILQQNKFPLDAIVLDLYWYSPYTDGGGSLMGNIDWYTPNWSDPTKMMKDFSATGVKTILIVDPYITTKSSNYSLVDSLCAKKPFTNKASFFESWNGTTAVLDIFKPTTQTWLWQNYKRLTNQGVNGWWTDKCEPDNVATDSVNYVLGNGFQLHNLYPLIWGKNMYNNFRKDFPESRLFNLARSGWAGSQRYGVLPWSGDVLRAWGGLQPQIPILLQSGMSGLAYMGADVGGFFTAETEKNDELDARWYQFATFSPMVRAHGLRSSTEPYNISQPFYQIVKRYLNTRYQLLPYIYTLAWQNATTGRPFALPMDYFESNNINGNIDDQYLFGEQLLVAPVMLPGMPQRQIYFPSGLWFDFWNNLPPRKGGEVPFPFIPITYDNIPVYAKAGSIIPMATSWISSTDYYKSDSLTIKYFQDISVPTKIFTMFHDDGADPNSLNNQRYELVDFVGHTYQDSVVLETIQKKTFLGNIKARGLLAELENFTSAPKSVRVNNTNIPMVFNPNVFIGDNMAYYNLTAKQLQVRYSWNCATPIKLVVQRDGLSVLTATEPTIPENTLKVYPNPSLKNSAITFETSALETGSYQINIFDASGKNIFQTNLGYHAKGEALKYIWNVENQSGTFIVKLQWGNSKSLTKKIIIE